MKEIPGSLCGGWIVKIGPSQSEHCKLRANGNPRLRAELRPSCASPLHVLSLNVQRQGLPNTNDHHITFLLSLHLLSRVLLQPFPLLILATSHSLIPVQHGLLVHLKLLILVSTELGPCSGFSPDIQPAIAYK